MAHSALSTISYNRVERLKMNDLSAFRGGVYKTLAYTIAIVSPAIAYEGTVNRNFRGSKQCLAAPLIDLMFTGSINYESQCQGRNNYIYPLSAICLGAHYLAYKKFTLGMYLAKSIPYLLQGAHLAMIVLPFPVDTPARMSAAVRLLTWSYLNATPNYLPARVDKVAKPIIKYSSFVGFGYYIVSMALEKRFVALASTVAMACFYSFFDSKFMMEKGLQFNEWIAERSSEEDRQQILANNETFKEILKDL